MTVRGAAAETTVAVTPTVPMESGRSVVEPDGDEDGSETEDVELAGSADMATSMRKRMRFVLEWLRPASHVKGSVETLSDERGNRG
jgi:hypothetical protein